MADLGGHFAKSCCRSGEEREVFRPGCHSVDLLRRGFSAEEARRQLYTAIVWGRYGEPFEYDAENGQLVLGSDPAKVG